MRMNSLYKLQNLKIGNIIYREYLIEMTEIRYEWLILIYEQPFFVQRIFKNNPQTPATVKKKVWSLNWDLAIH